MDDETGDAESEEGGDLQGGGSVVQVAQGPDDDPDRGGGVDEGTEVDLAEGDEEPRVDRQEQHEVEAAGADVLRKVRDVGEEEGGEDLLDEVRATDELSR